MGRAVSLAELAGELAQIAAGTRDPETAQQIIVLAQALLIACGHLPEPCGAAAEPTDPSA
jgi:hypothetical protein